MSVGIDKARLHAHQMARHEPAPPCHYCGAPESREVSIELRGKTWTRLCEHCEAWKKAEWVQEKAGGLVACLRGVGPPRSPYDAMAIIDEVRFDLDEIMEYLEGL